MKLKLIFLDWQRDGESLRQTVEGIVLSLGSFHGGTTFDAEVVLNGEEEVELRAALDGGAMPVFYVYAEASAEKRR